jgi:spore germination protein GerM
LKQNLWRPVFFLVVFQLSLSVIADETVRVKVFFIHENRMPSDVFVPVNRQISKTAAILDLTLRELLKGPTEKEKDTGLRCGFFPDSVIDFDTDCISLRDSKNLKPLIDYYIGVNIRDGVAIVNFKPEGMCYLQQTASQWSVVGGLIERTAKQFRSVQEVQFAIEGKVVEGWDA